jgi:hypothetical protein
MSNVLEEIINFAKSNRTVTAISFGRDMDEGFPLYYFYAGTQYDFDLGDRIAKFELDFYSKTKKHIQILQLPSDPSMLREDCREYLGEIIWKREKN